LDLAPGNCLLEEVGRKGLPTSRIEGVQLLNAENATEVTAREIKQVSRYEFGFLAIFNAVQIDPRLTAGFARSAFPDLSVGVAAVFAKRAGEIMLARL